MRSASSPLDVSLSSDVRLDGGERRQTGGREEEGGGGDGNI